MLLYHATYKGRLKSIIEFGLGTKQEKNYSWSDDGVIYFATEPDLAESLAEDGVVEDTPEEMIETGICILVTDSIYLDELCLIPDENFIQDKEIISYQYFGTIPANELRILSKNKSELLALCEEMNNDDSVYISDFYI